MVRWVALSPSSSDGRTPPLPHPRTPGKPFPLAGALTETLDYNGIFQVVRRAVRETLGRERPGLGLGLSLLPPGVGAYWPVTGNYIVLNEGLTQTMQAFVKSRVEFNSFLYVILAHEYLHALGYLQEEEVHRVTTWVTRGAFGPDHPATRMAEGDLWEMYPFLRASPAGDGKRLRLVPNFDSATTSAYIR